MSGGAEEALSYVLQAMKVGCDRPESLNNVAWVLATHEDANVRQGAEAVRLVERACELGNNGVPAHLDTLAAAYAELGQFDKAVKTAENAMQLARAAKSEELAKDIQNHLELYKAKRSYRESFNSEGLNNPEPK